MEWSSNSLSWRTCKERKLGTAFTGLKISYEFIYKRNKYYYFFRAGKCYSTI